MAVQIPFARIPKLEEKTIVADAFLTGLLKLASAQPPLTTLAAIRQTATTWVERLQTPTNNDEEWRFTNLSDLLTYQFVSPSPEKIQRENFLEETTQNRLVFINGHYDGQLSSLAGIPKGVYVGNLNGLPPQYNLSDRLGKQPGAEEVFTALNTATFNDAAVIWLDKNVVVPTPIHLLFISVSSNAPSFNTPRLLLVTEAGASLSLVEEYLATEDTPYFNNCVSEIYLAKNSHLNHIRLQQESASAFHISKTIVSQARHSRYTGHAITLGAQLSRHNWEIIQQGEQTETNLNGLTAIADSQLADTHSIIALTQPHGNANQLHKCIVDNSAAAVFNGKVFVPKAAQSTNANQLNRNLLLSPKARINTKPELQITADNVKCSHGATVSQLEAEEVFYLRSRGLTETDARHLLIDAFAAEIIEQIPLQSVRERLSKIVANRFNK